MAKLLQPLLAPSRSPRLFQQALHALVELLETYAWPHSRRQVALVTVSLFSRARAVERQQVPLITALLQVGSLNDYVIIHLLKNMTGNTGAATGNTNAQGTGNAQNNGQNAAAGKLVQDWNQS
tara:strand:- start:4746 stop:5114 length:369 start_codon:yes stop_codon:yes gene_type:complete